MADTGTTTKILPCIGNGKEGNITRLGLGTKGVTITPATGITPIPITAFMFMGVEPSITFLDTNIPGRMIRGHDRVR
jgi:hypothetical protein